MKAHELLAEADSTKFYEIQRGDTLTKIASKNSTTVDAIMDLNRGNKAIRDRDTIYAGGTIKLPSTSTGFDSDARVKRQRSTSTGKPDDIAKIGNQEFPLAKGPDVPGPNDDMGGKDFGIDNPDWEFPTVELGFGDPGYTPIIGNRVEKRKDGVWYYPGNPFPARPDVARFAEKRLKDLDIVKSKDIGSQQFPMTKGPKSKDSNVDKKSVLPPRPNLSPNKKGPTRPGQERDDFSPVPDGKISSGFGPRQGPRLSGVERFGSSNHQGVDFEVPIGTSVYAPNNAVVLKTGWGPRAGNYIELGNSQGNLTHKLFHLNDILVKKGDTVTRGQEVAKSGNTGDSTGAHLHWEKWVDGNPVDPVSTMKSWSKQ